MSEDLVSARKRVRMIRNLTTLLSLVMKLAEIVWFFMN